MMPDNNATTTVPVPVFQTTNTAVAPRTAPAPAAAGAAAVVVSPSDALTAAVARGATDIAPAGDDGAVSGATGTAHTDAPASEVAPAAAAAATGTAADAPIVSLLVQPGVTQQSVRGEECVAEEYVFSLVSDTHTYTHTHTQRHTRATQNSGKWCGRCALVTQAGMTRYTCSLRLCSSTLPPSLVR